MENSNVSKKKVNAPQGVLLLAMVVGLIIFGARIGANSTITMGLTWVIIYIFSQIFGFNYNEIQAAGFDSIRRTFGAILILVCVGMLVGTWIAGGTIPTLIYYGLALINPKVFLLCCLLITSIMSVFTGTSYGSAASAGVAMMGIGLSMGLPAGMIAGAILCGATFGDKISPLSDTTNVCPALCGGSLFPHIKSQMYTTLPAYIICLIVFTIMGLNYTSGTSYDTSTITSTMEACAANFNLTPLTLIPLAIVVVLLVLHVDTIPAIMLGSVAGAVMAVLTQGESIVNSLSYMWSGFSIESGNEIVDRLMNRGGISNMSSTIFLLIFAIGMGSMLEEMGVLKVFIDPMLDKLTTTLRLVLATMAVSYAGGALTAAMTSANVITGKVMSPLYKEKGLAPEVCSRTMEDTGTIGGVLMPWHANSIYYAGVLGVAWSQFVPYCMLSYIVPIFSIICAATGIGIFYIDREGNRISKEKWKEIYSEDK